MGGPLDFESITLDQLRTAAAALAPETPKEIDVFQFRGEHYLTANARMVSVANPERGVFTKFDDGVMEDIAREAMPGIAVQDSTWLQQYDAYYYDQDGARALPVLRVRYNDPEQTWLYLDPHRGSMTRYQRLSRLNRWLYHGLHSLDFPFLYYQRPLWDIVVIGLSLGGIALSITTLLPSFRRLVRHGRHWAKVLRNAVMGNRTAGDKISEPSEV
jgi:hypothetical protein